VVATRKQLKKNYLQLEVDILLFVDKVAKWAKWLSGKKLILLEETTWRV
jgi:hypothetical protein